MSTLASSNRVHCTRANESDDMLVRGVRVPVATEGREESAEAVPEPEVQEQAMERDRLWLADLETSCRQTGSLCEAVTYANAKELERATEGVTRAVDDQADGFK